MNILITGIVAGMACAIPSVLAIPLACFILLSGFVLGGES